MPKLKPLGLYADRKETVKRIIGAGMKRKALKADDLERRKIMNRNTYFKRKREANTARLGELWDLDRVIGFTDNEILQMFGRGGTN